MGYSTSRSQPKAYGQGWVRWPWTEPTGDGRIEMVADIDEKQQACKRALRYRMAVAWPLKEFDWWAKQDANREEFVSLFEAFWKEPV